MKCPSCHNLVADFDDVCPTCRSSLRGAKAAAARGRSSGGGEWGYLFAIACGIIPVITLGGAVPILLGVGGAGACMQMARSRSIPLALRVLGCIAVTAGCWILLSATLVTVAKMLRR